MEANAKASREYARSQVTLLLAETLAQEAHVKQLREYEQGFAQSALSALTQVNNLVGAYHFWFGASKELTQAEKDLAATTKLRDAMVKILGEDETKARKEALEAAEKAEKQAEREAAKEAAAEKRRLEALNLFNQELIKESVHYEKVWQAIEKADTKEQEKVFKNTEKALRDMGSAAYTVVLPAFQQLSAADRESLPTQREIFKVRQELVRLFPQMTAGEVQQRAQELATQPVIRQTISQTQNLRQAHQQLTAEI